MDIIRNILKETLQDSAVFRILLESTAHEAAKLINTDRTNSQSIDPFFHQRLYSDFTHACDRLQSYPDVGATVRFYTHTPTCWMMIVDNTAHFQPYTFGRSASKHSVSLCIGDNMPVFKFQMQPKGRPFEILEDHFLKLWQTSNLDLSNLETRIENRNTIIKDIFHSHSAWFEHVYKALYTSEDNVPLVKFNSENSGINTMSRTSHR
ncbi:MAG TPA: hypothetical protein ACFYD4_07290 [Candidatus Wunengus sp. YC61]|uniref:hypothetical protein n=1 Tax=Candidatus Wunengus sp. YC61 TaxID=3367698 RepID=UPI0040260C26